jgi:uncharacterized protein (UPF0548 family)
VAVTFAGDAAHFDRLLELVMCYRIFPPSLLSATVCEADGRLAPGSTVVQRIFMGPIGLESGVRVSECFDTLQAGVRSAGFECRTLVGHPERGVERFTLTLQPEGRIAFAIDSRSRLAAWYALPGAPVARAIQRRAVASALAHVSRAR